MDVQGMWQAQGVNALRERQQNLPWGQAVGGVFFVEVELALIKFERVDAARVNHFDGHGLGCVQCPGEVIADSGGILLGGEQA